MMPGFGFDVVLSIIVEDDIPQGAVVCVQPRTRFPLTGASLSFLPIQMGLAVCDVFDFLSYKYSIFQPDMDRRFSFPLFYYVP